MLVYCRNKFDIFIIDNEDDNDMAVAHPSAYSEQLEDLVHKSRAFDDETVFVQANGTPKKKVCILLMITVAKLNVIFNRTTKTIQVVI